MPSPDKKPQPLYDEVAEWNRLLDYEEECMARGVEQGVKELQERRKQANEQNVREPIPLKETNLSPWARKLVQHLKEFRQKEYEDLKQNGTLFDHCQKIADQAGLEMSGLLDTELPYNQAFEVIRDQLYLPTGVSTAVTPQGSDDRITQEDRFEAGWATVMVTCGEQA